MCNFRIRNPVHSGLNTDALPLKYTVCPGVFNISRVSRAADMSSVFSERLMSDCTCQSCSYQQEDTQENVSSHSAPFINNLPLGDGEDDSKDLK